MLPLNGQRRESSAEYGRGHSSSFGFRKEFDQFQVVRFIDFLRRPAPWADKHMTDEVVARNTGVLMHGFAPGYCEGERFAREHGR